MDGRGVRQKAADDPIEIPHSPTQESVAEGGCAPCLVCGAQATGGRYDVNKAGWGDLELFQRSKQPQLLEDAEIF